METTLDKVKKRLLITGNYFDDVLTGYIQDTKKYILAAGVLPEVLESDDSIGCIYRGVFELFNNYDSFSDIFRQEVIQLTGKRGLQENDN